MDSIPAVEGGAPVRDRPLAYRPWISEEDVGRVVEVLRSGLLSGVGGKWNGAIEASLREYLGVRHALAVSNGTVAIHMALKALGVGPGDEVVTTPLTFVASASTILHSNAVPVFADVDRETLNLDPASVEEVLSDRTRAVVVVHLAGYPAEMDDFMKLSLERGFYVVEDAAQALGAVYRGRRVGSIGHVGTFSFYPTKTITTGEGGAVVTSDDHLAGRLRLLRSHGEVGKYHYELLGYNYRLTEFQAALGYSQLSRVEEVIRRKDAFAKVLMEELEVVNNDLITYPRPRGYVRHAWHLFQILLNLERLRVGRDRVVDALRGEGIHAVSVAYPTPLYREALFTRMRGHGLGCPWSCPYYGRRIVYRPLPNAEWVAERVVSLLIGPMYTEQDAVDVARALVKVLRYYRR